MKLTSKKLKSLILEVLEEGMNTASMIPDGVYVLVTKREDRIYTVAFADKDGEVIMPWTLESDGDHVYGDVSFYTSSPDDKPCSGGSIISVTEVADGWGPLLYDVAMEAASIMTSGLTSDRHTVSDEASKVWDYYDKKRPDVKKTQLDNESGELTPDKPEDDCGQSSSREGSNKAEDWSKSSLSRMYNKAPTTLKQLRDSGKLILNQVTLNF